jgi:protein phosphatase
VVALALPLAVCLARNAARADRRVPPDVVRRQHRAMRISLASLSDEGFDLVAVLDDEAAVGAVEIASVAGGSGS